MHFSFAESDRRRQAVHRLSVARSLGDLPLSAIEEPDEINRFKTSDYAEDVELVPTNDSDGVGNAEATGERHHAENRRKSNTSRASAPNRHPLA
jgi:hypothetical protein